MPDDQENRAEVIAAEKAHAEITRKASRELLQPMAIFGITMILLALANAGFSVFMSASSQRAWCNVLNTLNSAPAPKTTDAPSRAYAEQLAKEFRNLRAEFGC